MQTITKDTLKTIFSKSSSGIEISAVSKLKVEFSFEVTRTINLISFEQTRHRYGKEKASFQRGKEVQSAEKKQERKCKWPLLKTIHCMSDFCKQTATKLFVAFFLPGLEIASPATVRNTFLATIRFSFKHI